MLDFLNQVLPPDGDGYRCWFAVKKGHPVQQGFSKTNQELISVLRRADAQGSNVFFACSTYKEPTKRTGENVKSVKSFWLDIDAGVGKPYADIDAARDALDNFRGMVNLPLPTITVCSGNGLHAYWVLDTVITPEEWLPVAQQFKLVISKHGFDADPSRTSDRASILRPPNTLNWKDSENPKEVYVLEEGETVSFEKLKSIIKDKKFIVSDNGLGSAIVGGLSSSTRPDMKQGYPDGERTSELTRRAGWFLGPDQLSEREVIKKCLEWNQYNNPPLEVDKIVKTVESLARREGEKQVQIAATAPFVDEETGTKGPPLPYGYKHGPDYVIMGSVKDPNSTPEESKFIDIVVCKYPFFIAALREEETSGVAGNQSVKITSRTPHSPWKSFVVPRRELLSATWMATLGGYGVVCEPGCEKLFKTLIHKMLQWRSDTGMTETSYKSFGWKNNRTGFVAGRRYYSRGNITDVSGTTEFEKAADLMSPRPKGSINRWRAAASRVFVQGCEAQALAMLASFAAPLMDLLFAGDEGGAIMSLVSSKSGQGKTAAILAAETVWGQTTCLRITEQESSAAQFRAIGVRCNMPVVIDEWGNTDIDSVRNRVATFTGGLDKKRLTMTGEDNREQLHWKTVLIGTTNLPIVNLLHQANYGAQAARIFEVPVSIPEHLSKTQSADLNQEFEANAGFAGPVFLAYLLNNYNLDDLKEKVNRLAEEFGKKVDANTEERFKTRLMAAIAMVSIILTNPMVGGEPMLEFNVNRIVNFGLGIIRDSKKGYIGQKSPTEHLMDFVRDNMHNFVVVDGPFNANKTYTEYDAILPKQKLMGRYEQKNEKLYVPHDIIHKFAVSIRIPYIEFAKELTREGLVLNRNRQTHLTAGCVKLTPVRMSCWEIDLTHDAALKVKKEIEGGIKDVPQSSKLNHIKK